MATTLEAKSAQQDSVPTAPRQWYRDPRRQTLAVVILLAATALVSWFIVDNAKRKERFASRGLDQAQIALESGNLPLASSELQRVITRFEGTDAANEAIIRLNQVRMVNGQSELAAVGLRDFVGKQPDSKFATPAYGLLGAALENSKRWGEAGDAYLQASKSADIPYLKANYFIDAGRAYRVAGRHEDAARAYRTILEKYPDSPSFTEAQVRLAELTDGKM